MIEKLDSKPNAKAATKGVLVSAVGRFRARLAKRVPLVALVWTGACGLAVALALGSALVYASDNSVAKDHTIADQVGKVKSLETAADVQDQTIGDLQATVDIATSRESELSAKEASLATRAAELDAREAAVKSTESTIAANTIPGNGTFRVGTDVQPGQYRSEGGPSCYWSRMNASGDDTIDNYIGSGQAVVTIQPSDGLLKTSHCAPFTKVG